MKKGIFFSLILATLLLASCGHKDTDKQEPKVENQPDQTSEAVTIDEDSSDAAKEADAAALAVGGLDDEDESSADESADADEMNKDMEDADSDMDGDSMEKGDDEMDEMDAMGGKEEMMKDDMDSGDKMGASHGSYVPYTEGALSSGVGKVVLAFHADWCPSCNAADESLTQNESQIPADVTILNVNFDDAQDLREKYNVTSQHTYVQVDSAGELLKKWRGGNTVGEIVGQIQ